MVQGTIAKELRATFAEPVFERIRRDRAHAPDNVARLLKILEEHLFDHALDVNFLKHSAGFRDNSIAIVFHSTMGTTPKTYITECRMEVANRFLIESELKIWQISELLGYSSLGVFSKAFARSEGMRPNIYRIQNRPRTAQDPTETPLPMFSENYLKRVLEGNVSHGEGRRMIAHLLAIYPETTLSNAA